MYRVYYFHIFNGIKEHSASNIHTTLHKKQKSKERKRFVLVF